MSLVGDPADGEPFAVAGGEPLGKLLDVVGERSSGMIRQIMGGEELPKQGRLVSPDRNTVKNIITTILHRFNSLKIGQTI